MAASRVLETNKRDIIIRGSFFPLVVSLSLFLRIFIYLFILLTSMFCRNFSLKRARIESIKRVREMILGGGIEERKVGVRVPFASPGIIPGRRIGMIDAPSSTLSSMVWIFRRPSLASRSITLMNSTAFVLY